MAKCSVEIVYKAEKEFLKLSPPIRRRIQELILSLEVEPRPVGAKKLKETPYYRIRSGDFRILYSIDDKNKLVRILSVGDRKDVYRPF